MHRRKFGIYYPRKWNLKNDKDIKNYIVKELRYDNNVLYVCSKNPFLMFTSCFVYNVSNKTHDALLTCAYIYSERIRNLCLSVDFNHEVLHVAFNCILCVRCNNLN